MDIVTITEGEVLALSHELYSLVHHYWESYEDEESVLLEAPRFRQIGECLNRCSGYTAMNTAVAAVAEALRADHMYQLVSVFTSEVNWCWDGIGEWRA